ncbi:MAG: hypothetical protein PHQ27_05160, partial [Victivallales bacterium]|nr:hypothetical protein [Victivallales bacterium]
MQSDKIKSLRRRIAEALSSFNVLFEEPVAQQREIIDIDRREFMVLLRRVLRAIEHDLTRTFLERETT